MIKESPRGYQQIRPGSIPGREPLDKIETRHRQMRRMFDAVAPRYDFLNRLLSLGIDRHWRKSAVRQLQLPRQGLVLDAASGTCDVALEIARQTEAGLRIVGTDISDRMLAQGRLKVLGGNLTNRISLIAAACESLPLPDNLFDGAVIAFGIRNVADRSAAMEEFCRALRPQARLIVLEFSEPPNPFFRLLYHGYFRWILPLVGAVFSEPAAYRYLPASVADFPSRREFKKMLETAGFVSVTHQDLSCGIVTLYTAIRP
jgi:demethylmenaquinone methyltransferase / 2-methoxy-6-polyprenyl-1,4-benzoquinol methylase